MKKEQLSFSDVEQLLMELARHDLQAAARDEAQTELMRGAARGEIRRVFLHRRCLRLAGSVATIVALGGSLTWLLPEGMQQAVRPENLATALPGKNSKLARSARESVYAPAPQERIQAEAPAISYSATLRGKDESCDIVIYAVPL